ncbi:phosphatase PAP2 family protein [Streptomyces sp. NPDC001633]|uniref:phosphatase PAP2 family protein n=1 Tax=Streptomyces sp. NPDC001633 TaxID=3364595 RepID=UPI00367F532E
MTAPGGEAGTGPEPGREPVVGRQPRPELGPGSVPRPGNGALRALAAVCAVLFAAAATTVSVRHGAPLAPEQDTVRWAAAHHGEPVRSLARALTATGTGLVPYLMAVLAGLLAGRGATGRLRAVTCTVVVLAVGQAIRYGLMELLARARPPAVDWAGHATGYAFPSGHATTSALAAGLLAWGLAHRCGPAVARTWCAVLALWAAGVGLTRVYLGVHWLGDVVGGWLLAATWLTLALLLEPAAFRTRAPRAHPGATQPRGGHSHE